MKIEKEAVCGNIESGDIQVTLSPNEEEGIVIELTSVVKPILAMRLKRQCGRCWQILKLIQRR